MRLPSSTYVIGIIAAATFVIVLLVVMTQSGALLQTSTLGSMNEEPLSLELLKVTGIIFGGPDSEVCSIRAEYRVRNRRESEIIVSDEKFDVTPLGNGFVYGHQILPRDANDEDAPPATIIGVAQVEKNNQYQMTIEVVDAQTGYPLLRQDTIPCPSPQGFTVEQ